MSTMTDMSTKIIMDIRVDESYSTAVSLSYLGLFCALPLWFIFASVDLRRDNVGLIFSVKEDGLVELCELMNA